MPQDMVEIKKEKYEEGCCVPSDNPSYPYGTSLSLRNDLIDDLNVSVLSVGDVVEVRSLAVITSKSEREEGGVVDSESHKSIDLQLTHMVIKREDQDRVKQLYGG
jgi:hypothetical protein